MKTIALLIALLLGGLGLQAQQTIALGRTADRVEVLDDQASSLQLQLNYAKIQVVTTTNRQGDFAELLLEGGFSNGIVGQPKLPVTQRFIEIPFGAMPQVKVLGSTMQEFALEDYGVQRLLPMQAPVSKNDVPEGAPFVIDEQCYQRDAFQGEPLAQVEVLGTLRGYHIAKLTVAPVQYNPVQNKIRVYNDIAVELSFPGGDMSLTREVKAKTYSPYFDVVGEYLVNEGVSRDYPEHPDMTRYPIKYVIVADPMFAPYLNDFVEWKTQKGFEVVLSYTDEVGATVEEIEAYVHGLYDDATADDPAPSFLLFVGDVEQIPARVGSASHHVTDLYYASVDGDYFPDMYYGRLSAQTPEQLIPQIEKTLYYEQYQFADPSYLNGATLIAGWDDYWAPRIGKATVHYGLNNWFNADHDYSVVSAYYGPSDYQGCYEDDKVSVSLINYTAHCSASVWGTPALSATTIRSMNNEGLYPLAIGNCCESSQFNVGECVGESWVRTDKKGAVCYIGSAPSTYWYEDAWWAVGAYHITDGNLGDDPVYDLTTMGAYDAMHEGGYVSTGGLTLCGNLAVTEACNNGWSDAAHYYWEAYNVLGDPSLVCYHTEGEPIMASYDPVVFKGFSFFNVEAEPQSFVAMSKDGVLLGTGMVDENGELSLTIDPIEEGGFVSLVVTKPQHIPYICHIPVATPGQPFLTVEEEEPMQFDYNHDTDLTVTVKNNGDNVVPAGTLVELLSPDDRIQVVQGQCQLTEAIPVGGTAALQDAFTVKAGPEVRDGETFRLITMADCGDMVNSDFYVTVNKPVFEFVDFEWSGEFIAGQTFEVDATFRNVGGAAAENPVGHIGASGITMEFPQDEVPVGRIEPGETATCHFIVQVVNNVPESMTLEMEVSLHDVGVSTTETIAVYNLCHVTLELHDAGGNGWEGASLKMMYQDGKPTTSFTLEDGASATYEFYNRQGYRVKLSWMGGAHDEECSFSVRYDDGTPFYESDGDLHGNLITAAIDCYHETMEVEETPTEAQVMVYPNPTSGQVSLRSATMMQRCLVVNSLGQTVLDSPVDDTVTQLNLEGLTPGLYLIRVTTEHGGSTHKLMIK
ncbi:MAG: T9SS type A sorting domain-containing protein [Bacteroidales bacterium]|nr:T9SS type A sorting domain-containing protein [Bacteroidales bacterium]